mgnify:CR=1 FL=1
MNMNEYLQKKQQISKDKQKPVQDRVKELEDAERRAREIRESLKAEKKKEFNEKVHNFNLLGMRFRPWTLNDMVIILFFIVILVVGSLSFMPGGDISSDTSNKEGFFSKLFGGFTVKSVKEETTQEVPAVEESSTGDNTATSSDTSSSDEATESSTTEENSNPVDFSLDVLYQNSPFAVINISNTNNIWYTINIRNMESYNIKCSVNHYVNNELKQDQSTVTIETGSSRDISIREVASDAVNTLAKVKLEVTCSDGADTSTENTQIKLLKFYFS